MADTGKVVVHQAPDASPAPEAEEGASVGEPVPTEPAPTSVGKIGENGRALLREGFANIGLGREYGNRLADWLDKQQGVQVLILGKPEEPPLRVFGTPDKDPVVVEQPPFTPNEE